jgi:hypothetical protein
MRKTILVLFGFILLIGVFLLLTMPIAAAGIAQTPSMATDPNGAVLAAATVTVPVYSGIDVVFLVDQSGSMCGRNCGSIVHPEPNDPQGWRFLALKNAIIDRIGPFLWQVYPNANARIGIVEFGTEAFTVLPPTPIQVKSEGDWKSVQNQLATFLSGYQNQRQNTMLGNTSHLAAFQQARKVFDEMEKSDSSNRIKALFLITDGRPCLDPGAKCPDWEDHLKRLRDTYLPQNFPVDKGYRIYIIGINDSTDYYWDATRSYWEQIANRYNGVATKVSNQFEVAVNINRYLAELMSPLPRLVAVGGGEPVPSIPDTLTGDSYPVRPYLQLLEIEFYKSMESDRLQIKEADSPTPIDLEHPDPSRVSVTGHDQLLEIIRIKNPQPGLWSIVRPKDRPVVVLIQGITFQASLVRPLDAMAKGIPQQFEVNLVDTSAQPAPKYTNSLYNLTVQATIRSESGTEERLDLLEVRPGVYGNVYLARTDETRIVHLSGISRDINGTVIPIFDFDGPKLPVKPVNFRIVSPGASAGQGKPSPIEIQFVDNNQKLIDDDARYPLNVTLTFKSGGASQPVTLTRTGNSTYTGTWTPGKEGLHSADLLAIATDAQGNRFTLFDVKDVIKQIDVKPTIGLIVKTVSGVAEETQFVHPWFPFYAPLTVDVELRDTKQQLFDAATVSQGAPNRLFILKVTDPNGADKSGNMVLQPTAEKGHFRAIGDGLDTWGPWTVEVTLNNVILKEGYAFASPMRFVIKREENWLSIVLDGLSVLVILGLLIPRIIRYIGDRRGFLLEGTIYICDTSGLPLPNGTKSLRSLGVNRVQYPRKELPAAAKIKRLTIYRHQQPTPKLIRIEAEMEKGGTIVYTDKPFGSRSDLRDGFYIKYVEF